MKFSHRFFLSLVFVQNVAVTAVPVSLGVPRSVLENEKIPFLKHRGEGAFDSALAMNIQYAPIKGLRKPIEAAIGRPLEFYRGWKSEGEAHVTVITPVEYFQILRPKVSMADMETIAVLNKVQASDLVVFGLGSASAKIDGKTEETFFLLVDSLNLRRIRLAIYDEFVRRGGAPEAWDPTSFYPHITIGYTKRDLHEGDGAEKNIKHSWDHRFKLEVGVK